MDSQHEVIMGASSPSKGKGVDTGNKIWRVGWWDFYPLLERPKRPLQWSQSSVIFTAHPTESLITARHFSSSKQFVLPSPTPIIASPGSYDPPSILSVSPGDLWLFAYFPRREGEGVGCLWKRGPQIDNWVVKECWAYPKCGGVVAASWLANHREWTSNAQGDPLRLPPRGPNTPISDPTLLIVTEDHWVHLTYIRFYLPGIRFIKRHLPFTGISTEMGKAMDVGDNSNNTRRCIDAAIGIGYNETSVFIATHSSRVPPPTRQATSIPSFNSMDLSVPVDLTGMNLPDQKVIEWDNWGEERTIELFEVTLRFDGSSMALVSNAVTSVECTAPLTGLTFACVPPQISPATSDNNYIPKRNLVEKGKMSLLTSIIDFHDYSKPPTSTLALYALVSRPVPNNPRTNFWSLQKESTRVLETGVVTYVQPFLDLASPNMISIYTCLLGISGPIPIGQKEAVIGTAKVLNFPDLSDDPHWESTVIKCPTDSLGRNLPVTATISPNGRLLCTLSSSLTAPQNSIHTLPKKRVSNISSPPLSLSLAIAILGRVSTSDLVHAIRSPHVSLDEATNVIYHTLDLLDTHYKSDIPYPSTWDVVGIATEVYRARSLHAKDEKESEMLKELWQTAHDICSLAACNIAFEDCKEEDGYDLDAVWQIISICTWVVNFTERLMKACVLSNNSVIVTKQGDGKDSEILTSPILLHLAHPFALQNLITALGHVRTFRKFLGSLPAGGEHAKIAQAVLIDAVDCSGVDIGDLICLLEENVGATQKLEPQDCRKALAACHPVPAMRPQLGELLQKISQSETILNKSTLFIKPFDLVDGVARISIMNQSKNDQRDVITKGIFDKQVSKDLCLRCGGKTSMETNNPFGSNHSYPKWTVWELMWQLRCICGGSWLSHARN